MLGLFTARVALPMPHTAPPHVTIIGGGPAGLMAAEVLSQAGVRVDLYDGMPSVGRKFLLAGVGGMNITHSEAYPAFVSRYAERAPQMAPLLLGFGAQALCEWIHGLGIQTFVGTSGRVFPTDMKAAPLLRAWLKRLRDQGVVIHTRHRWVGWNAEGGLLIHSPDGEKLSTALPCCWRWAVAAGRAWAPTGRGLTCWRAKACPMFACSRAIAASTCRPGAN